MDRSTAHGQRLGRRILGGAGTLSLAPYRVDPTAAIPVVAHRLSDGGRLVVLCPAADAVYFGDAEVRVDGVKQAPELAADITVAGLHALGEVRWLTTGEARTHPSTGIDDIDPNSRTADLYSMGVVQLKKVLVHSPCGVTKLSHDDLRPRGEEMELASRELDARDAVGQLSPRQLGQLLSDALVGFVPGFRCSEFEMEASAALPVREAMGTEVWVSDIDTHGVMLSTMYGNRLTSVFVDFPEELRQFTDLVGAVSALAERTSARHASPRI